MGSSVFDYLLTYAIIILLVMLSGLFSGLTLGLLGLDKTGLEIVIGGGTAEEKKFAKKLVPLRKDGNRLLCTLLLGNVLVNAWLSIFLATLFTSTVGLVLSTALIVIFGEILPQAVCSRHALKIGASLVPLVRFFLLALAPVAVPLGWCLDLLLGQDVGTVHTRTEILSYMRVHVQRGELDDESGQVMRGALEMTQKPIVDVMTPLEDVYMLPEGTTLSFKEIREIFEHGFSRVPVFRGERTNIVGLLFVKDLIFVDPEDETPLSSLLSIFDRGLLIVDETNALDDVLRIFKRGHGHLALVRAAAAASLSSSPKLLPQFLDIEANNEIVGIVTLEDIVEEIIGDEIIDETDVFVDVDRRVKVQGRDNFDFTKLRRLDAEFVDERLSPEEIKAVTAHLQTNLKLVDDVEALVRRARVVDMRRVSKTLNPENISKKDFIYVKGTPATFATLVLSGKLSVLAGKDNFRSEAGPWSVLGVDALVESSCADDSSSFVPDFTAFIATSTIRCLFLQPLRAPQSDDDASSSFRRRAPRRLESQKERRIEITERRRQLAMGVSQRKKKLGSAGGSLSCLPIASSSSAPAVSAAVSETPTKPDDDPPPRA